MELEGVFLWVSVCAAAFLQLLRHVFIPEEPEGQKIASMLTSALSEKEPLWQMGHTKDSDAALAAYRSMHDHGGETDDFLQG